MCIDDIIEIRELLRHGKEFKAVNLFFALRVNITYPGFKKTEHPSIEYQGKDTTHFLVRNRLSFLVGVPRIILLLTRVQEYFLAVNYLTSQLMALAELEKRWDHFATPMQKSVSKGKMDKFGYHPMLIGLASKKGLSLDKVLRMTWAEIDNEMSISAMESHIAEAYYQATLPPDAKKGKQKR